MTHPRLAVVLPFVSPAGGGVTEAVRILVAALARSGAYEITVISFASDQDAASLPDWPTGITIHRFAFHGPARFAFSPGMARHMARHRYDIVHVHGIWMFHVLAAGIAMARGAVGIVSPHGMLEPWILARSARLKTAVSALFQKRVMRRARAIHVLTEKERGDLNGYLTGLPATIIPNFVPDAATPDSPAPWAAQVEGRDVWLFLARIHEKKGWPALLDAWDVLCAADPGSAQGLALVFCGWIDGDDSFAVRLAQSAARHGNVIHAGPQYGADKLASFARADVFVLPSMSEGLPMTVLEAVRQDALIAMSAACNLPDFFPQAAVNTGTDTQTILAALQRIRAMPSETRAAMRAAATAHLQQSYGEQAVMARYLALYAACQTHRL
ncbi:putative poly(glycerol-phosphate) alpha-glucosyltransferase [Citreicella sp. 357]|nr:putative poly(glycerol-phosphate) alpha-glucosyltransferase [Citreicella sp. 357]